MKAVESSKKLKVFDGIESRAERKLPGNETHPNLNVWHPQSCPRSRLQILLIVLEIPIRKTSDHRLRAT